MFIVDGALHWSASDLTAAAACEYAVLRTLDHKLGWGAALQESEDPLMRHIAALGDVHEERLLAEYMASGDVVQMPRVLGSHTAAKLQAARDDTLKALLSNAPVVYQAAFSDGEFFGYADFVERADDGWRVCDAKLARQAKPQALLQLGAYAEQMRTLGLPVSSSVALLLGNGERVEFQLSDVLPVFSERRERLRELLGTHRSGGRPVEWGASGVRACGGCAECRDAAEQADDLVLVAGLRMDQRRKLRAAGILTMGDLAAATSRPGDIGQSTFDKLRAQAAIQWSQRHAGEGAPVVFEMLDGAAEALPRLPAPSAGDLFFDFEGDPLYDEGDPSRVGLEYLWGILGTADDYTPIWAHDWAEEREAFVTFMELVAKRRADHPDMHIYHYAPYETSALKRLAMRYQTCEKELDDLLRSEVFVDLYATVRASVRVSAPSYSIKKLEPLYMGDELRSDDDDAVSDGGASVVAYHEFRTWRSEDPPAATKRLAALADYNEYDCLSTLRLRDWLLARAEDVGVRHLIQPRTNAIEGEELTVKDPVFLGLMKLSGSEVRNERTAPEQACAMLATSLDYFRRENKQFWWEHFERLTHPIDDWAGARDVFVVESAEVVSDWQVPEGKAKNARRVVRLVGEWTPGSKNGSGAKVAYPQPAPPKSHGPERAPYGACDSAEVRPDDADTRVVLLTESRKPEDAFAALPVALLPGSPPPVGKLEDAIKEVGQDVVTAGAPPSSAAMDILARRAPRLRDGRPLPRHEATIANVVDALAGMDHSYVAVQGPPGTGKTYAGSRVIKCLVEQHGWRIGVVAQSHAVVENMLDGIVKAGLDPVLVGKAKVEKANPAWTSLKNVPKFLDEHVAAGCVIGGTAWDFANDNTVPRQSLDLLVIDEAGQFSLAPTIAVSVAAQRLLLLGDPQQLPQVSQGTHAEPVDTSALGWLLDGHRTLPEDRGYFLAESYRMHPALCGRVSVLSYEGRLHAAAPASQRSLEGVQPGLEVVTVPHAGNQTASPEEAAEVVAQVRAHLGARWEDPDDASAPRPLDQCDFVVVAPYNAQVTLIRARLKEAGLGDVRVGTVDKFQGQEAPIAIVSMTASSHGDVPRGMGFLLSRNRVNVAVSRAQWKAIVIRSASLTAYMPSSVDGLLELGAFIGLCGEQSSAEDRSCRQADLRSRTVEPWS